MVERTSAQTFGLHGGLEYQVFQGNDIAQRSTFRPSFGPFMSIWLHHQLEWRTDLAIMPSGSPYIRGHASNNPISAGVNIPTMVRFNPRSSLILMGGAFYEYWMTHTPSSEVIGGTSTVSFMNVGPVIGIGFRKDKWDFNLRADWDAYSITSPDPKFTGQAIAFKLIASKVMRSKERRFTKRRLKRKKFIPGR